MFAAVAGELLAKLAVQACGVRNGSELAPRAVEPPAQLGTPASYVRGGLEVAARATRSCWPLLSCLPAS